MVSFMCDVNRVESYAFAVANTIDDKNVAEIDKYWMAISFIYETMPKFLDKLRRDCFSRSYIKEVSSVNKEIQTDLERAVLDSKRYKELALTIREGVLPNKPEVGLP